MPFTETYPLSADTNKYITIKLYTNVKNVPNLRKQIINGSLNCCIIKPSLIVNPFQVVIAANKAIAADKFTTKNVYTEILFNLSISTNITQSLQKFGIDDNETNIVVAVVHQDTFNVEEVLKNIDGELVELCFLEKFSNEKEIQKAYKLSDVEVKSLSLLESVVSRISAKEFI